MVYIIEIVSSVLSVGYNCW